VGFAEKRGNYWRGRYKTAPGKHLTVVDETGKAIRFATKGEAQRAASEAENKYRRGDWRDPALGQETFGEYANRWYEGQDLAASTMQNYKRHIEEHLLPEFEDKALAGILRTDVDLWEKKEKAAYAASSVKTWRSTLHLIFEDAIDEGLITSNPAARRRGRGKRAGRSRDRGPEKVVTDALGILLTAESAALLFGRDDEFVAVVLKGCTGALGRNRRPGDRVRSSRGRPRRMAVVRTRHGRAGALPTQGRQLPHHRLDGLTVGAGRHPHRPHVTRAVPVSRQDLRLPRPRRGPHRGPSGRQARRRRAPRRSLHGHGVQRPQPPQPRH
jgi:hypothetical protein